MASLSPVAALWVSPADLHLGARPSRVVDSVSHLASNVQHRPELDPRTPPLDLPDRRRPSRTPSLRLADDLVDRVALPELETELDVLGRKEVLTWLRANRWHRLGHQHPRHWSQSPAATRGQCASQCRVIRSPS